MPKLKIAINGFGRIGRLTARALSSFEDVQIVAVNDLTSIEVLAHLFKYDTAQGRFDGSLELEEDALLLNGSRIKVFSEKDPSVLPWGELGVDVVVESTGVFRTFEGASAHLKAGARKVIISAPPKSEGVPTIVLGVNDEGLTSDMNIISNASCTTNCLAPMVAVLLQNFGIEEAIMHTVHAYTANQRIQDAPHKDLRRARAAAQNIVPTTTGAAKALAKVIPAMKGKLVGSATRVPVITGSLTELYVRLEKNTSLAEVHQAFHKASEGELKGVLAYSEELLVSSDIIGNPYSCVYDVNAGLSIGKFIKIVGWYDNEFGYSSRMADLSRKMTEFL